MHRTTHAHWLRFAAGLAVSSASSAALAQGVAAGGGAPTSPTSVAPTVAPMTGPANTAPSGTTVSPTMPVTSPQTTTAAPPLSGPSTAQQPSALGGSPGQGQVVPGQEPIAVPNVPPPPPGRLITLADAMSAARRNAPAVLTALAQARTAEAQVALVSAPYWPTITGTASLNGFASNGSFVSGGVVVANQNINASGEAAVNLRWTLYDFGRTANNVEAARRGLRSVREESRNVLRIAMAQAAAAYFTLLADLQLVESLRATVGQRQRQLAIAQGLVQAGSRAPIEQTRSEVALDSARLDLSVAEAAALNDGAALASALALDPAQSVRAAQPVEVQVDDDPTRAADAAVAARPEVAAARMRVLQAESQVSAARSSYLPSLSTQASGSVRITARPDVAELLPSQIVSGSVVLTVPIFDPTVNANLRVAEANLAAVRATVAQQVLSVRTEAVQAAIAVRSARQTYALAQRAAAGAEANLRQAEGRYAAGVAPVLELVDAQAADATSRLNVVRARLQLEIARVRLLSSVGRLGDLESMH